MINIFLRGFELLIQRLAVDQDFAQVEAVFLEFRDAADFDVFRLDGGGGEVNAPFWIQLFGRKHFRPVRSVFRDPNHNRNVAIPKVATVGCDDNPSNFRHAGQGYNRPRGGFVVRMERSVDVAGGIEAEGVSVRIVETAGGGNLHHRLVGENLPTEIFRRIRVGFCNRILFADQLGDLSKQRHVVRLRRLSHHTAHRR